MFQIKSYSRLNINWQHPTKANSTSLESHPEQHQQASHLPSLQWTYNLRPPLFHWRYTSSNRVTGRNRKISSFWGKCTTSRLQLPQKAKTRVACKNLLERLRVNLSRSLSHPLKASPLARQFFLNNRFSLLNFKRIPWPRSPRIALPTLQRKSAV